MTFKDKAAYPGPFDRAGVPLLDYRGALGEQYNPIAIAQYGLAHYNRYVELHDARSEDAFLVQAKWLLEHLERNRHGLAVWNHHFDWHYRSGLKAPWYSALAQGQGISLLLRAWRATGRQDFRQGANEAFAAFTREVRDGGVTVRDADGRLWIEEYLVEPPSHILNGFLWASWGIYDHWKLGGSAEAGRLFAEASATVLANLPRYDTGFWSCYEITQGRLRMLASPFYHALHIVQLDVMARLTRDSAYEEWRDRWRGYAHRPWNRRRALAHKALFKLLRY